MWKIVAQIIFGISYTICAFNSFPKMDVLTPIFIVLITSIYSRHCIAKQRAHWKIADRKNRFVAHRDGMETFNEASTFLQIG